MKKLLLIAALGCMGCGNTNTVNEVATQSLPQQVAKSPYRILYDTHKKYYFVSFDHYGKSYVTYLLWDTQEEIAIWNMFDDGFTRFKDSASADSVAMLAMGDIRFKVIK